MYVAAKRACEDNLMAETYRPVAHHALLQPLMHDKEEAKMGLAEAILDLAQGPIKANAERS